jgi:hypothetical protein
VLEGCLAHETTARAFFSLAIWNNAILWILRGERKGVTKGVDSEKRFRSLDKVKADENLEELEKGLRNVDASKVS